MLRTLTRAAAVAAALALTNAVVYLTLTDLANIH